jgi:hypothetical protein
MGSSSSSSSGGIGIIGLLGVLFVGLKLGGVIDWSWWYVTMPFWGGLVIIIGILVLIGGFMVGRYLFNKITT